MWKSQGSLLDVQASYPVFFFSFAKSETPFKRTQFFWPATSNIVGWYKLHLFVNLAACCCVLLGVVEQSLKPVNPSSQQLPHFIFSVRRNNIGSVCTAPPTLLKPRARITHSLFLLQLKRAQVPSDDLVAYYCACIRSSLDYACPVLYYMHLQSICKPNLRELKREPSRVSSLGFLTRTL